MKKTIVIVMLAAIAGCFAYLGIYQKKQADELKLELTLTQKALYALEVGLESAQYKSGFNGNPNEHDKGLFLYDDYGTSTDTYKSRIITFGGLDYPIVVNQWEESARIAESYDGYELEKVYVFDR